MTPKGTFAALPVRAQAYIIQLHEDTSKIFSGQPLYWRVASMLNYHHGMRTVSSLSAESYWFSQKRRNPTIDELLEKVFSDGEPLTILQVRYSAKDAVSVEVFSEIVKTPPEHTTVEVLDRGLTPVYFQRKPLTQTDQRNRRKAGADQTSDTGCYPSGRFDGMDPVIRATISDNEGVSADASLLLCNSYVDRLQIISQAPEAQSNISAVLRNAVNAGDLVIGELWSYEDPARCNAVDTVALLVATARLQKVTLNITPVSLARNYARIFDAAAKTSVKCLYMDLYREFGARKQPEEAKLEPTAFLAIREQWLDFVFTSLCDHAVVMVRHGLPAGLPCPFSPNDIVRRFLDMDSVDHFTTCVIDGTHEGPLEACTEPVAKRQAFAHNGFMSRMNRSVGDGSYDVYYVRNERAGATLSVLVGWSLLGNRVILMKGVFECGEEYPHPLKEAGEGHDDYEEDNDVEEGEEDEGEEEEDGGTEEEEEDDFTDNDEAG